MKPVRYVLRSAALLSCVFLSAASGLQAQQKNPQQVVEAAVQSELQADRTDASAWIYRDREVTPEHDFTYLVAESPAGAARRKIEDHGHPLTPAQAQQEDARLREFLTDSARQQKVRHDAQHDDNQAESMLKLLPRAFLWTIDSEAGDLTTLAFKPNPDFSPQSMEAKVLSAMAGRIVVSRPQNRIQTIEGTLVNDVTMGWGLVHLRKGGSFHVERREVAPHHWQITDSHVHIEGRALLFKTIGQQEDETKTEFRPSPAKTVAEAVAAVNEGRP